MSLQKAIYTQFISMIVQIAQQLAAQLESSKAMILQVASQIGIKDIQVEVKRLGNKVMVAISYEFEKEELAKQVISDIKKRLGGG